MNSARDLPRSWSQTLASLLPLWLLALAISVEGFPRPPVSPPVAISSFFLSIFLAMLLLWRKWIPAGMVLYYSLLFVFLVGFDEISTTYKTPFLFVCALLMSAGIIYYQRSRTTRARWVILVTAACISLLVAGHAVDKFWQMTAELGYVRCFPDAAGCPPLDGRGHPWWWLLFSL